MNILDSLQWRYATKKFDTNRLLDEKKINILTAAFNLTATSYGLQPLKLVILQNKAIQQSLVTYSMEQQQVAQASHVLIICIEDTIDEQFIENYFENIKTIRHTEDAILQPFKTQTLKNFKEKTPEEITSWSSKQAYLTLGNLLTVCATEQIDACPMEGFIPEKYDEILELKAKGLRSVLVLPVGYRADDDMFASFKKVRRPLQDVVIRL